MDIQTYLETNDISLSKFAQDLEVSRNLAYQWVNKIRPVAARHCWPIEKLTGGKVSRAELRPSDWHKLWPELIEPERRKRGERRSENQSKTAT